MLIRHDENPYICVNSKKTKRYCLEIQYNKRYLLNLLSEYRKKLGKFGIINASEMSDQYLHDVL